MTGFKERMIARRVKKAAKSLEINRPTVNYQQAQHIGILFSTDTPEKHQAVKNFKKKLEADGKKVTVITFLDKGKENHGFSFDFYQPEEFSVWGKLESETATRFCEQKFDYLFHIDLENQNPMLSYMLANSHAKCRVGRYNEPTKEFYELMFSPDSEETKELIDQMYHYIKILSTHAA